MANEIISRDDAKAQGLKRYFTGKPCPHGHIAERLVSSFGCLPCLAARSKATRMADPQAAKARDAKWRTSNPESQQRSLEKYRSANRDKINERCRRRRRDPETREAYLSRRRELRKLNRGYRLLVDKEYRSRRSEELRQYRLEWYKNNRDKQIERNKKFKTNETVAQRKKRLVAARRRYVKNRGIPGLVEKQREYMRRYYREKPNKMAHIHKRRSQKKGSNGSFTAADLAWIMKAQNGKCAYCRLSLNKRKKHVDHIQPLSCGGSNDRTNIQYLCAPCNLTKGAKDPILFAQELGRLL